MKVSDNIIGNKILKKYKSVSKSFKVIVKKKTSFGSKLSAIWKKVCGIHLKLFIKLVLVLTKKLC